MRQQARCGNANEEDTPAPVARASDRIQTSHLLIVRTASPAARPSVVRSCGCTALVIPL
ncbi:hypothetical protein BURMUCGD1_5211 [Burkholderia multivorans CGD1]|nr:hypothetical protein BURMUCGD1_5211 [Burkholderia multivorans CGD1]